MKKYIITLAVSTLFYCHAMDTVVRPADPLERAKQLIADENPSKKELEECKRLLARAVPLSKLNESELAYQEFTTGRCQAEKIAALQKRIEIAEKAIARMKREQRGNAQLLFEGKARLEKMSKPEEISDQASEDLDEGQREKVLLTEVMSILTFHVYASDKEGAEQRRASDYRRIRTLLSEVFRELKIDGFMVSKHYDALPAAPSSEHDADDVTEVNERPASDGEDEDPLALDELAKEVNDIYSKVSATLSSWSEDESTQKMSVAPEDQKKGALITDSIDPAVTEPPLTNEQRAILRYVHRVKTVEALTEKVAADKELIALQRQEADWDNQELEELLRMKASTQKDYRMIKQRADDCRRYSAAFKKLLAGETINSEDFS